MKFLPTCGHLAGLNPDHIIANVLSSDLKSISCKALRGTKMPKRTWHLLTPTLQRCLCVLSRRWLADAWLAMLSTCKLYTLYAANLSAQTGFKQEPQTAASLMRSWPQRLCQAMKLHSNLSCYKWKPLRVTFTKAVQRI